MGQYKAAMPQFSAEDPKAISEHSWDLQTDQVCIVEILLDQGLSILWANDAFYLHTGYLKEEFNSGFQTLRQYYKELQEDFTAVKDGLDDALKRGCNSVELTVHFPLKTGIALGFVFLEPSPGG